MPYKQILNHKETLGTGDYEGDRAEDLMWCLEDLVSTKELIKKKSKNKTESKNHKKLNLGFLCYWYSNS